jgi:hypothetical protein
MQRVLAIVFSFFVPLGMALACLAGQPASQRAASAAQRGWIALFDGKSLDGWYIYLQKHQKNEDPARVFQAEDGAIHVYKDQPAGSAVPAGYLATETPYSHFRVRLEYKWGTKKFAPRTDQRRDAGLLYHVVGADAVWPRCIECQIQENDVGDCFTVRGVRVAATVEMATIETPGGPKLLPRYKPPAAGGAPKVVGDRGIARIVKSSTHEHDGWNTVEVEVRGSQGALHIVNGHTVFEASELRQLGPDNENWQPLPGGRIALQAEFAEVYYRNVEIRALPEEPLQPTAAQ